MILGPTYKQFIWKVRSGAGTVDLGDGCAVMILEPTHKRMMEYEERSQELSILVMLCCDDSRTYSQTDDDGMRRAGAVDLGHAGVVMILRPYSETDDRGMREAGAVDLGDGAAVMILRTYSEADDGGMREGRRAGAVDLHDAVVVMILRNSEIDDGGMRAGSELLIFGDAGVAVMILQPYSKMDDGGMRRARNCRLGDGLCCDDSRTYSQTDDELEAVYLGDSAAVKFSALRHKRMMKNKEWHILLEPEPSILEYGNCCSESRPPTETDDGE
ncbi:hypothetical protein TNCV_270621 [Trichonephila clavipes]|nr:hypothetical protein TNCV_270621 [Trichonephila clavipes]